MTATSLLELPLLAGLSMAEAGELAARLDVAQGRRGTYLFRRGDPGDSLYVLVSGQVALELPGAEAGMPIQRADHTPARALAASATQEGFPLTLADSSFPPRRRAGRFGEHRSDAELEPERFAPRRRSARTGDASRRPASTRASTCRRCPSTSRTPPRRASRRRHRRRRRDRVGDLLGGRSGGHLTGTNTGAPLSFTRSTSNFAGLVLLAFRPTTWISSGPS